jgi:acylphosphatase
VEALLQGDSAAVETMIAWCRRGPPSALVAEVRIADGSGDYSTFETLPTE